MKNKYLADIKKIIDLEVTGGERDDDFFATQYTKLQRILSACSQHYENNQLIEIEKTINSFISDEIQKRKLLSFCADFVDPTVKSTTRLPNGEEIQLNAYLQEDELCELFHFVKRHSADGSFGDAVYKIMDSHNLSRTQVYRAASLRRQDFARATDARAKNVTKQIAWQIIIGLHCNMDEADEVLFSAGYIRRKSKFDLVMEYFIRQENYDIWAINAVLEELQLKQFSVYVYSKDSDAE